MRATLALNGLNESSSCLVKKNHLDLMNTNEPDESFWDYSRIFAKKLHQKSVLHIPQLWILTQLYLGLPRSKKYKIHVRHPLSSAEISLFQQKSEISVVLGNSKKIILIHDLWFSWKLTKFHHVTEIILWMWSCGQSVVTRAFLNKVAYHISSNKRQFSNKRCPLISAAPLGIHIEISVSL